MTHNAPISYGSQYSPRLALLAATPTQNQNQKWFNGEATNVHQT